MHLHRFLPCSCGTRIDIPLAIPSENVQSQIPWPSDAIEQNFLCFVCRNAKPYTRSNFLLGQSPSTAAPEICVGTAVYEFSVPCEKDNCTGRVEIHAVMPKGIENSVGVDSARPIVAANILCNKGIHRHNNGNVGRSEVRFGLDPQWSAQ